MHNASGSSALSTIFDAISCDCRPIEIKNTKVLFADQAIIKAETEPLLNESRIARGCSSWKAQPLVVDNENGKKGCASITVTLLIYLQSWMHALRPALNQ